MEVLIKELRILGNLNITNTAPNTLQCFIGDVKMDFIRHDYPLLTELVHENEISMASIEDISAMKLNAIRGARKDFYDLYFLLNQFKLKSLLEFYRLKYTERNQLQLLKSLSYFEDAENQPEVNLLENISWDKVKKGIQAKITNLLI